MRSQELTVNRVVEFLTFKTLKRWIGMRNMNYQVKEELMFVERHWERK